MDENIENRLTKLPPKMQGKVFRMLGTLYKQEELTMISFIEEARRSLKLTREELAYDNEEQSCPSSSKLVDDKPASNDKQRLGAISARHRQKSAKDRTSSTTEGPPQNSRIALEEEIVRVLSARSRVQSSLTTSNDSDKRVPTPSHLFDVVKSPEATKKNAALCDEDFKEERDEIMQRMNSEQNKLESVKERQSALLRQKMDKMANKQQESEIKATEVMMEATRREELQHSAKLRQEQKMKERLEEKKRTQTDDGATPFVIDLQPK